MDLNHIYSPKRTGINYTSDSKKPRSNYERDYDRIIFSSAFRRLQNKTQVFPLPGSVFVHNRLTHSLEVSSVGRSLGQLVGQHIFENQKHKLTDDAKEFYRDHLKNVISAAALCHDIGNPAFGHSGEDAMTTYFKKNEATLAPKFSEKEYADLTAFEGNANSLRVLSQQQTGKSKGGLKLTYSTLSAIAKYPCESTAKKKKILHRKKFGFLQAEKETFLQIAHETGMIRDESVADISYFRHPFVWLVEAADDICYNIIDLEDAHRLGIIRPEYCEHLLYSIITQLSERPTEWVGNTLSTIGDQNERIGFLRALSINQLVNRCFHYYIENLEDILAGKHKESLLDIAAKDCGTVIEEIQHFSVEHIYNDRSVLEIENAGYHVIYQLLDHFINPILAENKSKADDKAIRLIPAQYHTESESNYDKVLTVIDYLSGMTDLYATDLYKKIKGIDVGLRN